MSKESLVKTTIPARAEFVDLIRLMLYGIASKMKFSFEEIEDMKVAVSEAVNNAVVHAYGGGDGEIDVTFGMADDELTIQVRDRGISFEPDEALEPASLKGKTMDEIQSGGLGLYLMQALMDRVEWKQEGGTSVTLAKKRARSEETA